MFRYVLMKGAEADLFAIARYTDNEWGEAQRKRYIRIVKLNERLDQ